jgi:hypothetical protein
MKKQLINEVKQLQKTAGLLSEAVGNIPQTLTFTFKTKFILSKMNEALDGDLLPVNQIDFNKLQKELQEDLYIQIDNGFYFEELVANDGLIDFKKDDDVNELHPDKEWDEEDDKEEPYENDMDNLDTSLPR